MKMHLAKLLVKENLVTVDQIKSAIEEHRDSGLGLGESLVDLGYIQESELVQFLSREYGVPIIQIEKYNIEDRFINLIPKQTAVTNNLLPINLNGSDLIVAMSDPSNILLLDDLSFVTGHNIKPVVSSERSIREAINKYYGVDDTETVVNDDGTVSEIKPESTRTPSGFMQANSLPIEEIVQELEDYKNKISKPDNLETILKQNEPGEDYNEVRPESETKPDDLTAEITEHLGFNEINTEEQIDDIEPSAPEIETDIPAEVEDSPVDLSLAMDEAIAEDYATESVDTVTEHNVQIDLEPQTQDLEITSEDEPKLLEDITELADKNEGSDVIVEGIDADDELTLDSITTDLDEEIDEVVEPSLPPRFDQDHSDELNTSINAFSSAVSRDSASDMEYHDPVEESIVDENMNVSEEPVGDAREAAEAERQNVVHTDQVDELDVVHAETEVDELVVDEPEIIEPVIPAEPTPQVASTEPEIDELDLDDDHDDDKVSILVIDDSPTIQKIVSITLEKKGYDVHVAGDGMEALAKLNEVTPRLIFLDINLPHMDGYQLCKIIKSHDITKEVPVIMLSGKDGFFDKMRGKMVGAKDYITKPFQSNTLVDAVEKYSIH